METNKGSIVIEQLRRFIERRINSRPPDFVIGDPGNPYLLRWWLIPRNWFFNIYAHRILRDDNDRALHDHMYFNLSIILSGGYVEVTRAVSRDGFIRRTYVTGNMIFRSPWKPHRIELRHEVAIRRVRVECVSFDVGGISIGSVPTAAASMPIPALTLFITGPRIRRWGFICPQGWRHWKEFTAPGNSGAVGKGCGD